MTDAHDLVKRRNWFLVFATWAASAYLIGFAADAVLSVLDDAMRVSFSVQPLAGIRNAVAGIVAGATLPMLFLTIFVPHLPRAVLLPLIAFLIWTTFGAPPLSTAQVGSSALLGLSSAQLLLAANALRVVRRRSGGWRLSAAQLPVLRHLWLRTAGAFVLTVIIGTAAAAGLAAAALVSYLEQTTGGYMQFAWTGIEMRETTLRRGRTTVHLVATAHIAEPQFYRLLRASIPNDAIVFVEGVSDRGDLLQGFSHRPAAQALGLSTQDVFNELLPPPDDEYDYEDEDDAGAPAAGQSGNGQDKPRVVRADIDAGELSGKAIEYLLDIDTVSRSAGWREALARITELNRKYTEGEVKNVFEEIIGERNTHLLNAFDMQSGNFDTVFVPWGAMHMPGIEKGLTARRFRVVARRNVPLARYRTIMRLLLRE